MEKIPYFDSHCDTVSRCCYGGIPMAGNDCQVAFDKTAPFSQYAQIFACYWNTDREKPGTCFDELVRMHDFFLAQVEKNSELVVHCKGRQEVLAAHRQGKMAALLSIEESALLECDPEKLELAAEWGVQSINLTWNHRNLISGTCAEYPELGLSDRGREFVKEAQRLGILMDVSHLSPRGFWDLFEMTEKPIIASHSDSDVIHPHRRNLTDDQFRAIVETGGMVGLNLFCEFLGGAGDIPTLIRHLEHFLELGGEDHIGIGGDLDGCDEVCHGIDNAVGVANLWAALKDRGYSDALLRKIFFENWLQMIRD